MRKGEILINSVVRTIDDTEGKMHTWSNWIHYGIAVNQNMYGWTDASKLTLIASKYVVHTFKKI